MTANTYSFTGPGERWAEGDPTAEDYLNVSRINNDHLHEALNALMDTANPDGLNLSVATPLKIEPVDGTVWTMGWWNSADGRWWLLVDTAGASPFTRAAAEFYIPIAGVINPDGSLAVPTS